MPNFDPNFSLETYIDNLPFTSDAELFGLNDCNVIKQHEQGSRSFISRLAILFNFMPAP